MMWPVAQRLARCPVCRRLFGGPKGFKRHIATLHPRLAGTVTFEQALGPQISDDRDAMAEGRWRSGGFETNRRRH